MEDIKDIESSKIEEYLSKLGDWALNKGFQLVLAIICMYIGMKLSKLIVKMIRKSFKKSNMEESVASFLLSLIKFTFYAIVFITAASIVGFQVTSLVTILGTASLAIGLALQGSLANFAGGVLILILKPFRVGDYIIENDKQCEGTVVSIDIFYTKLQTIDNRIIVVPNGVLANSSLTNVTAADKRMMDIVIPVAYDADIKKAKALLKGVVGKELMCFVDKADRAEDKDIKVFVKELADSSVNLGVRFWLPTKNYWDVRFALLEDAKAALDEAGVEIPYNKLDVYVKQ